MNLTIFLVAALLYIGVGGLLYVLFDTDDDFEDAAPFIICLWPGIVALIAIGAAVCLVLLLVILIYKLVFKRKD